MAVRICLCHPVTGAVLSALDGHHGDAHGAAWLLAAIEQCRAKRGVDPVAVEYSPLAGGDHARDDHRNIDRMRLELHRRPDGGIDVIGLGRGTRRCAASVRVIVAPADYAVGPAGINGRRRSVEELAQRWETTDSRRASRRLQR